MLSASSRHHTDDKPDCISLDKANPSPPLKLEAPEDDEPRRVIEYLHSHLMETDGASPDFFVGTLEEALSAALHPDSIENRRPLLIYLHHDSSAFRRLFCSRVFCNHRLIDYLRRKFLVWPWDVTSERNEDRLKKWWSETFPYLHSPSLRPDECPMLIGIMECVSREETDCSLVEYQTEILHCGDVLIPTNARSSLPTVLEALRTFRQEFIFHEKVLVPFNVGQLTGLCPDVLLEVSKYLYLDEIINAFSMGFLQVLREGYSPVHLKDPSQRFLQIIPQHLDPRQITSLHISDDPRKHMNDLSLLRAFDRLTSLTILSERAECPSFQTQDYAYTFHTSVDYSEEDVESYLLRHLRDLYSLPITHLRVRCTGECNNHFWNRSQQNLVRKNTTIVSVVVDAEYHPSSRHAHWCSIDSIDVIESALLFFESLVNVQQVRLSIHRYYPGVILSVDPWLRVVRACVHLQRVILELEDYGNFQQFATDIEQKLRQFRPGLIFRIETR